MQTDLFSITTGYEDPYNSVTGLIKVKVNDMSTGETIEGAPQVDIYENEEKKYDSMRIRLVNHATDEYADLYCNLPKKGKDGLRHFILKNNDFYRQTFDIIFSVLYLINPKNVIDENDNEINKIDTINIEEFAQFLSNKEWLKVEVNEELKSGYNSFMITKIE